MGIERRGPDIMRLTGIELKAGERGSSLEKAILVLGKIAVSSRPVGLADLASEIELPRPTIHRILQQLADMGLILRAPQKDRYHVGPTMMRLSALALASRNAHPPTRAVLQDLVDEIDETCNVGMLDQDEVVYIERVEGSSSLRLHLQVGSRVALHCTAIGKLLIAEQHKNVRTRILNAKPLKKFTENTLTDEGDLEAEFAAIRANGYSYNNEEFELGLTGIAVPIRDARKKAVAALAIHAPLPRMNRDTALSYLPAMQARARKVSEIWGLVDEAPDEPSGVRGARE